VYKFPKLWVPPLNPRRQRGNMRQDPHWGPTYISRRYTKFSRHNEQATKDSCAAGIRDSTSSNVMSIIQCIRKDMKGNRLAHLGGIDKNYETHLRISLVPTYSMVQSHSWEANWFAASQEIPPHFTEPEGSLPHSQGSATCLYPRPAQSSSYTHIPPPGDPS
jgi:hypothetical protein